MQKIVLNKFLEYVSIFAVFNNSESITKVSTLNNCFLEKIVKMGWKSWTLKLPRFLRQSSRMSSSMLFLPRTSYCFCPQIYHSILIIPQHIYNIACHKLTSICWNFFNLQYTKFLQFEMWVFRIKTKVGKKNTFLKNYTSCNKFAKKSWF